MNKMFNTFKLHPSIVREKVAEIFDFIGKITPITAGLKLDLRELQSEI